MKVWKLFVRSKFEIFLTWSFSLLKSFVEFPALKSHRKCKQLIKFHFQSLFKAQITQSSVSTQRFWVWVLRRKINQKADFSILSTSYNTKKLKLPDVSWESSKILKSFNKRPKWISEILRSHFLPWYWVVNILQRPLT